MPSLMECFRIYIFDESHKYDPEEYPEWDYFLLDEVKYIKVRNMDEVKEDLLNRKFHGLSGYGIMLEPNKCEVHDFDCGFDINYIEQDESSVATLLLLAIGHLDIVDGMGRRPGKRNILEIYPSEKCDTVRIYTYNNRSLNIKHDKIKYIDVGNEEDIKKDLLHRGFELHTYMVLEEDLRIKNKWEGYKNYKVISEKEVEDRMYDILSDKYDIIDKTVIVFTVNAKFDSHKNFKSVLVSNIEEIKEAFKQLEKEADDPLSFEDRYCYVVMSDEEIRLYETRQKTTYKDKEKNKWVTEYVYNWMKVDAVKTLGFNEMSKLLHKIKK